MARASSKWVMLVTFGGMAFVLCGALMTMMNFAKVEIKKRQADEQPKRRPEPTGPFAARIKELSRDEQLVTQFGKDDRPSFGRLVENKEPGLYLDIVSGEVLFTSLDKLDPVLGYVEFSRPFDPALLTEQEATVEDRRLKVKSKTAQSYLGWIITDDSGARRYIINYSALRFVPVAELEKNGLGQHRALFPPR